MIFDGATPADLSGIGPPDVYLKGGARLPDMLPEAPLVERLGGRVQILGYLEHRSTTSLLDRIRNRVS